jgi:hypothetical protein
VLTRVVHVVPFVEYWRSLFAVYEIPHPPGSTLV